MEPLRPLERASLLLLAPFALALLASVARRPSIFVRRHGRTHRLLGAVHLVWLALGLADVAAFAPHRRAARLAYDVALGVLGTSLTLAAAAAFDHSGPRTRASGALDADAVVSRAEMVEHAWYHALNLVQVLYLHALPACGSALAPRLALCLLATAPWLSRASFPVHSFSANYATAGAREAVLYRLKKYQYVAYKHALLHGLNVSAALATAAPDSLPQTRSFRLYWVCLNAAYVLEFFMQTLVRRKLLLQSHMLRMNATLMVASSLAALPVLRGVRPELAAVSLTLNFARRGRDLSNTALVAALGVALQGAL